VNPKKLAAMRALAEAKVRGDDVGLPGTAASGEEASRTLHELRVHQVELELQNEELRQAQQALEAANARYVDLYDLAPVGHCTLNAGGSVVEANLTLATLLGIPRGALVNQPFTRFIQADHQDTFYLRHKALLETQQRQSCELRMRRADGGGFWALLEASPLAAEQGSRVTVTDVNLRKTRDVERELTAHLAGLDSHAGDFREHIRELAGTLQAQEIMALGCNGFIQKPFALAALTQKIREIL
jgi:PAS domain S-box-containing protein